MENIIKGLIGLSGLALALAVFSTLSQYFILGITPEALSRACNNLALLAIALAVGARK